MKKPAPKFFWLFGGAIALAVAVYFSVPFIGEKLYEKGLQAKKEWRISSAISYFFWAEKLSKDKTNSQFEKANCLQLRGDFLTSQKEFEEILARSIINQKLKAQILNSNGANLFNQNKPDKALESHNESLKIARLISDKKLEAQALVGRARVLYHTQGKFDEAKVELEKALEIGRKINDELVIADALRNIGVILWWGNGELDRPYEEFYKPALELYRKNGDRRSEATMLSNIAHIYGFKGDGFQRRKLENESFAIRREIEDQAGLSESYRFFGQSYLSIRNFRKGRENLLKSVELSKKIGFRLAQNDAETYLAGAYVELGEYDEAIALLEKLMEREKNSPILEKGRLGGIAYCYLLKKEFENARNIFEEILEINRKSGSNDIRSVGASHVFLADTYLHLGNFVRAEELLKKSEELKAKHPQGGVSGYIEYSLIHADFRYRNGEFERSLRFLQNAAEDELNLFASSGTNLVNVPFPRSYDRLYSLLLEKLNKKIPTEEGKDNQAEELAFRFLEQRRYRSFRNFIVRSGSKNISTTLASETTKAALAKIEKIKERLKADSNNETLKKSLRKAYADYENEVMEEQFSKEIQRAIKTARPADLEKTRKNLDEKTALIQYIFSGEKVFALVLTKEKLQSFALPVTRSNLKNKTRLLQSSLFSKEAADETVNWKPIAESLRESLIEPFEKTEILENKNRLAIIPFGFLHDLPFAALTKNENGQRHFLVEDYILFFPPSATFLVKDKNSTKSKKLISFGRNSSDKSDLPPLKFAVQESKAIAEIFSGETRLENMANETEFKKLASKYSHLHFAMHAFAEPDMPLFSRLVLKSTAEDDGNLTVREIFELGIDADLVTIAACEGARSFSADGEGLIEIDRTGLTEAFLHAGSRSVLASLSPVSDKATTDLMQNFYTNLLKEDKAASLAFSQRRMLSEGEFTHPKYWANFVLIGTDR